MMAQNRLINNLHAMYRTDPYINNLCQSLGIEIDVVESLLQDIYNQYFFDSMTWGADIVAKQLDITLNPNRSQAEKNSIIQARWKSSGKSDVYLLQSICDSWKNGGIEVEFINGTIKIKFVGEFGVPTDLDSLKTEINKAKPCHLLVDYLFKYLLIGDIDGVMTLGELETMTLDKFAWN